MLTFQEQNYSALDWGVRWGARGVVFYFFLYMEYYSVKFNLHLKAPKFS